MASVTFDTLKFANRLKAAGVPEAQAEAQVEALSDMFEANMAELATKSDLRELELRMTIKLGSMLAVAVGVIAAIVKFL